jgi:hypothetical protein
MSLQIPAAIISAANTVWIKERFTLTAVYKASPSDCSYWGEFAGPSPENTLHPQHRVLGGEFVGPVREALAQLDGAGRLVLLADEGCPAPHRHAAGIAPVSEAFRLLAPRPVSLVYPLEEESEPTLSVNLHLTGFIDEDHLVPRSAQLLISLEEGTIIVLRLGSPALPAKPADQGWSDTSAEEAPSRHYDHLREQHAEALAATKALALALVIQAFGSPTSPGRL